MMIHYNEYTVGWICASSLEMVESQTMLDKKKIILEHPKDDPTVQVLALLTCEKFRTTIAMSNHIINKVLSTITLSPEPASTIFFKGFFKGDCVSQLGESLAGTYFLGLAAALVTIIGPFKGVVALDVMLKQSASDRALLPTVWHLNDLLVSLKAKSCRCGFADSVLGWQVILKKELLPRIVRRKPVNSSSRELGEHLQR
jgi:hypothetical protein